MVEISMQELLEAGVHFGHQTKRWNPKMKPYIFGKRNGIYIIDLAKTLKQFREAAEFVYRLGQEGRRLLFVGTKRQAQDAVAEEARRCGQYFVTHRWLGGTLTNFVTIRQSVDRLLEIEARLAEDGGVTTKKERLRFDRERERMNRNLEGVRELEALANKGVKSAKIVERIVKPASASIEIRGPEAQADALRQAIAEALPESKSTACKVQAAAKQ